MSPGVDRYSARHMRGQTTLTRPGRGDARPATALMPVGGLSPTRGLLSSASFRGQRDWPGRPTSWLRPREAACMLAAWRVRSRGSARVFEAELGGCSSFLTG